MNRSIVIFFGLSILLGLGGCKNLCIGEECENVGDDDAIAATPTPTQSPPFSAQLKIVAPYDWIGEAFYAFPYDGRPSDPDCEGTNECIVDLDSEGTLQVAITGKTFLCVNQFVTIGQANNGQTVELTDEWLEEGQCGLAPDGDYGSYDVVTEIQEGKVWIWLDTYSAPITHNTFYYKDEERLLEGEVSEDLSKIYYHRVAYTSGNEWEGTITL